MARCPITPPSPKTGMAASARVNSILRRVFETVLRAASGKIWLVAKPLQSMPA